MEQQLGKEEGRSIGGYPDTLIGGRFMGCDCFLSQRRGVSQPQGRSKKKRTRQTRQEVLAWDMFLCLISEDLGRRSFGVYCPLAGQVACGANSELKDYQSP